MECGGRLSIQFYRQVIIPISFEPIVSFFRISHYATTSTEESVYIIGGFTYDSSTGNKTPVIAEYKNDQWYNVGSLKQSRHAHGAITSGSFTMVIGGSSAAPDYKP